MGEICASSHPGGVANARIRHRLVTEADSSAEFGGWSWRFVGARADTRVTARRPPREVADSLRGPAPSAENSATMATMQYNFKKITTVRAPLPHLARVSALRLELVGDGRPERLSAAASEGSPGPHRCEAGASRGLADDSHVPPSSSSRHPPLARTPATRLRPYGPRSAPVAPPPPPASRRITARPPPPTPSRRGSSSRLRGS